MDSLECQTSYSLIPVSEIDTNYCVENNYCPSEFSGVEWSALYINDVQHVSAPLINIYIPEEISWDYTWDNEEFTLFVSGYNVDTAYIDSIITTQKSVPSSSDFSSIVSWLIPLFVPWLVVILFMYFVFTFVKKIF